MKILSVVGARPNFMKIAPFIKAIKSYNDSLPRKSEIGNLKSEIHHILVHTGQHYDNNMSESFFKALGIPEPDINLEVGSGSHAEQVGQTMIRLEKVLLDEKPDWVVVVGDVNATLAASVTAKKLWIKAAHIEAGLRSGDMTMPEEINRLVTDRLSDLLFTPDTMANENLRKEGAEGKRIRFVGNIMIDTLEANREAASNLEIAEIISHNLILSKKSQNSKSKFQTPNPKSIQKSEINRGYALMTLHRPSNVDYKEILEPIINFLCNEVAADMPLIWAIHPRTQKMLEEFRLWEQVLETENIILLNPVGYHEMLRLNMDATIMLTDSGGLQEECTVLGTPCLTLRWNTERPITLQEYGGASVLVGNNIARIRKEYHATLSSGRKPVRPELWDGKTAERIVRDLVSYQE